MTELKKKKAGAPKGNQNALGSTTSGAPLKYTDEWIENEAKLLIEWFDVPRNIWLKGFALTRGYDPVRFDEFANKSFVFSEALKKAKELQQFKLVDKALFNETNGGFTKFVLQNNHGWAERQQLTGDSNSPLNFVLTKNDGQSQDLVNGNCS